jgi:hypothetical protein
VISLKKLKLRTLLLVILPILLIILFGLTYIPHNVISIEESEVSQITIFDGSLGYEIEITDRKRIEHIINNLNDITFQKGKLSLGYMGTHFRVNMINNKGKTIEELIINSEDRIRYKGFFYEAKDNQIDIEYITELVSHSS